MLHEIAAPATAVQELTDTAAPSDDRSMLALQYAIAFIALVGAILLASVR